MITSRGVRALAVLLPAVVLLLPTSAHAEKVVTEDAVGDVQSMDFVYDEEFGPAPDNATADIARTVAAYGRNRLGLAVRFRDLDTALYLDTQLRIRTPDHRYSLRVLHLPGRRALVELQVGRAYPVRCPGLGAGFDDEAEVVSASVPAACLGTPTWVRVGVAAKGLDRLPSVTDEPVTLLDDGHRDTLRENSIAKGPRIHRG